MKKMFLRLSIMMTTIMFGVFSMAPTALALTWGAYGGPDLNDPDGSTNIYVPLDTVYDSSGNLHMVAQRYNFDFSTLLSIAHGVYNGTSWTFTDVDTTTPGGEPSYADISIDNNGVIGIAYSEDQTDFSEIIYYRENSDNWATQYTVVHTAIAEGLDMTAFAFDFDGSNNPVVAVCDFQGGNYGVYSYRMSGASFAALGTPYTAAAENCSAVTMSIDSSNNGSLFYLRTADSLTGAVWHATWGGSSWTADGAAITGLTSVGLINSSSPIMASGLDSSGNGNVVVWDQSNTANADNLKFGSYNGTSWSSGNIAAGVEKSNSTLHGAMVVVGTDRYVRYAVTGVSNDEVRLASNTGSGWSSELISSVTLASAVGDGNLAYNPVTGAFSALVVDGTSLTILYYNSTVAPGASVPEFGTYVYLATMVVAFASLNYILKRKEAAVSA